MYLAYPFLNSNFSDIFIVIIEFFINSPGNKEKKMNNYIMIIRKTISKKKKIQLLTIFLTKFSH